MNWVEEILIICGISLDIFASMECQGAQVARIEKKNLFLMCGLMAAWQLAALSLGNLISTLLCQRVNRGYELLIGQAAAVGIFFCLGIRLWIKAVKNERVVEHREEKPKPKQLAELSAAAGIHAFFAGIAFGFLGTNLPAILIMAAAITIIVVVFGLYTGYRLGFEHKRKAYIAGGLLLVLMGADVILKYVSF